GNQLAREAIDGFSILAAHAHAQLHLGGVRARPRERSMTSIDAQKLRINFVESKPQHFQPLAHDAVGRLCFLERLRPAIDQRSSGFPAIGMADGEFEGRGPRAAVYTRYAHAVWTGIRKLDASEIGHAIGRDV